MRSLTELKKYAKMTPPIKERASAPLTAELGRDSIPKVAFFVLEISGRYSQGFFVTNLWIFENQKGEENR